MPIRSFRFRFIDGQRAAGHARVGHGDDPDAGSVDGGDGDATASVMSLFVMTFPTYFGAGNAMGGALPDDGSFPANADHPLVVRLDLFECRSNNQAPDLSDPCHGHVGGRRSPGRRRQPYPIMMQLGRWAAQSERDPESTRMRRRTKLPFRSTTTTWASRRARRRPPFSTWRQGCTKWVDVETYPTDCPAITRSTRSRASSSRPRLPRS